jgi:iron-sulfur cluster repair protein YtfE (RIC family)
MNDCSADYISEAGDILLTMCAAEQLLTPQELDQLCCCLRELRAAAVQAATMTEASKQQLPQQQQQQQQWQASLVSRFQLDFKVSCLA